jgi:steroid 5-alpha reductase family enzyme
MIGTYLPALYLGLAAVTALWLLSIVLVNVSIIGRQLPHPCPCPCSSWIAATVATDVWWSLGFLLMAGSYASSVDYSARSVFILALVALWALRLAGYLFVRNHLTHGGQEDVR